MPLFSSSRLLIALSALSVAESSAASCKKHKVDFILLEGDAELAAIEDDIRSNLEKVGVAVTSRKLTKEKFNKAHQDGDFHLSFTETWGSPYDPHSYASGWIAGDEGHRQAMMSLEAPLTRDLLFGEITGVLKEEDHAKRGVKWHKILSDVHSQAIMLPLWGKRIPTVMNKRLSSYEPGEQQFEYPVHKMTVVEGFKNVTIAPGAQTGLFKSIGRLDPHTYRPNEFFANNWVYEGLVALGREGQIIPALAKSWTITDLATGGQSIKFKLRQGVQFHDGTAWNCAAAKLNFDHVFTEALKTDDWHGWYQLPKQLKDWTCDSVNDELTLTTKDKYYPLLQELSFIRPLRMLSPAAFAEGPASSPITANSCHKGWGNITDPSGGPTVQCKGITAISGTGPFKFVSRDTQDVAGESIDKAVVFEHNTQYWGGAPDIEFLKIVHYESHDEVKAALLDGSLDLVFGSGVLRPVDILDIESKHFATLPVFHSKPMQNVLLILNSGKAPTNDIQVRKTIVHAIDKVSFIDKELGGIQKPVDTIFPRNSPYCDVELTPKWDYDFEKASLLNCPASDKKDKKDLVLALGLGLGAVALISVTFAVVLFQRNHALKYKLMTIGPQAASPTEYRDNEAQLQGK